MADEGALGCTATENVYHVAASREADTKGKEGALPLDTTDWGTGPETPALENGVDSSEVVILHKVGFCSRSTHRSDVAHWPTYNSTVQGTAEGQIAQFPGMLKPRILYWMHRERRVLTSGMFFFSFTSFLLQVFSFFPICKGFCFLQGVLFCFARGLVFFFCKGFCFFVCEVFFWKVLCFFFDRFFVVFYNRVLFSFLKEYVYFSSEGFFFFIRNLFFFSEGFVVFWWVLFFLRSSFFFSAGFLFFSMVFRFKGSFFFHMVLTKSKVQKVSFSE